MVDFESIDPTEIKEGVLLNEDQTTYIATVIKDSLSLLNSFQQSVNAEVSGGNTSPSLQSAQKYFLKLESDLKYCVTIIRKDHVL
jgi:hypothetical protein